MARPQKSDIDNGIQGWDAKVDDNDEIILNGPMPIHEHVGDETDLASTFAPGAYDRCLVWVNHTTLGWTLYVSDGTAWLPRFRDARPSVGTQITDSTTGSVGGALAATADATTNNNFATLLADFNQVRQALIDHGLIQ